MYYSRIFNFNLFSFHVLLFRRALCKVADVNFYVNKGLLLLLLLSQETAGSTSYSHNNSYHLLRAFVGSGLTA